MTRLVITAILQAVCLLATTSVVKVDVTNTQATIKSNTNQAGNCTYRVSESPLGSYVPVNDVNTSLFAGSNSDARSGSIINDKDHYFVAGTRGVFQASDKTWQGRALAANTLHYGGITCGADAEVTFTFTTQNIPLGNTYGDAIPFNSAALGNYAVQTVDFTDRSKQYIDPLTGFKYQFITGPGMHPEGFISMMGAFQSPDPWWGQSGEVPASVLTSANWTSPSSSKVVDGVMASYTNSAQDILTVRMASLCQGNACSNLSWATVGDAWLFNIDAYQVALTGNGGGSTIQSDIALSWNGVNQGTEWETVTLPASTGTVTYPSTLAVGFAGWQGVNYPTIPASYWNVIQQNSMVTTSGSTVTWAGNAPFPLDPRILTAGSKITVVSPVPVPAVRGGSTAGPYNITGANNTLSIVIDGGATQTITLTTGSARTADQIVADINATGAHFTGASASVDGSGLVQITASTPVYNQSPTSVQFLSATGNTPLGFSVGTTNGTGAVLTEYTLASVNSATQLTTTSSVGTNAVPVPVYLGNFSLMIRKHSATAGTLNIDGAVIKATISDSFSNGASGFQNYCSHLTSTDLSGNVGRFCIYPVVSANPAIFWVYTSPSGALGSRYIGRAYAPASSLGVPGDEYDATFYNTQSPFDATDPNSWWISSVLTSTKRTTILKATYNNAGGIGGCAVTANYQPMTPNSNYDALDNCNITYTELTKPSLGKDIWSQLPAALTGGKFGTVGPSLSFVQNGYAVMNVNPGSQDTESWIVTVNLSTGNVKGIFSTYMNSANGSCRGCVLHGLGPNTPTSDYYYQIFNNYFGGSGTSGEGPYNFVVTTPLTTTPSNPSCTGVTDPAATWLVPYSAGCDNVTLTASDNIPCDPDPSAWESANMPACSWHGGWTQWQAGAIKPGDWIQDPNVGGELIVFGKNVSGSTWTVLRNVNPPQGPTMIPNPYNPSPFTNPAYLKSHAGSWTAAIQCSFHQNAITSTSGEVDGSTLTWDRKFFGFNHGALRSNGIITAEFFPDYNVSGLSVRMGSYPSAANTPETSRVLNAAPFAGKVGLVFDVQSHLGWDGNATSFTDMAPLAPASGGSFTLWSQPGVTNPTGTLYKIPAANAFVPIDKRRRAQAVWSGMYNFLDISGSGSITGTPADYFHYCSIDYPSATCGQPGESVGDVFMNIPQATIDGNAGGSFDFNRPNSAPLSQEPMAVLQYFFSNLPAGTQEDLGRYERRITTGGGRYNSQDTYSNSKILFNSNILTFPCGTPNMQRSQEICMGTNLPDPPTSSIFRGDFNYSLIQIPAGAIYGEVQFGYAENGPIGSFFCTSRQEACNTSSPNGTPFNFDHEPRALTFCSSGCSVKVAALSGRIVYYRTRHSQDGINWLNGPLSLFRAP